MTSPFHRWYLYSALLVLLALGIGVYALWGYYYGGFSVQVVVLLAFIEFVTFFLAALVAYIKWYYTSDHSVRVLAKHARHPDMRKEIEWHPRRDDILREAGIEVNENG